MLQSEILESIANGENSRIEFKRAGISREQQLRLYEDAGLLHVETLPVPGTSFSHLDAVKVDNYLRVIIRDPDIPTSKPDLKKRLLNMGFMTEDGLGNVVCSVAGILCFGINPRRYLPQAGLRLMSFAGKDKEYRAELDVVLNAPLLGRWTRDESGYKELVEGGLIEKFTSAIHPFISLEADRIDEYMRREKTFFYPWEAIREAVINALAHRDWTRSVDIEVCNYSDRLEIISLGKLPNSMNIDKMIAGQRSPRNSLIVDILRDCGYVDARGMGVRTKIIPLMKQQNGCEPIFEASDDFLKTILLRKGSTRVSLRKGS